MKGPCQGKTKTGEVYYGANLDYDSRGYLHNVDERPRRFSIFTKTSLLTTIQPLIWDAIKSICPGFIHSMTKE